uniref:Uncharacterized protein MANES_11G142900 n=1 Tax=Rhizophora mucronata TaxID=61149 RepID=A0A2P2L2N3_RHIMU
MMSRDGFSIPSTIRGLPQEPPPNPNPNPPTNPAKKKRSLPGTPDPDAEVIALSPKSLMATNRFVCEICNKGFQRDQNLQLHRRGHNLPWKLKQRTNKEVHKKVYICPERNCVHHDPSRALGDLTGIKKHFSRKHGEKKWKCEKCSKKYAVQSDWKAHSKICGTREYRCDCGTLFSRKDSFITHRAFCDALTEESARFTSVSAPTNVNFKNDMINGANNNPQVIGISEYSPMFRPEFAGSELTGNFNTADGQKPRLPMWLDYANSQMNPIGISSNSNAAFLAPSSASLPDLGQATLMNAFGSVPQAHWQGKFQDQAQFTGANLGAIPAMSQGVKDEEGNKEDMSTSVTALYSNQKQKQGSANYMSATALLQKAAQIGSTRSNNPALDNNSNSLGLFSSSLSNTSNFNSFNLAGKTEALKFLSKQQTNQPAENLNELVTSLSSAPATIMKDGSSFFGDSNTNMSSSTLNATTNKDLNRLMIMQANGKRSQQVKLDVLQGISGEGEGSLTRDFLGVGGEAASSRPFLQHELAKFAPMGSSAKDLGQYSSTGHH